MTRVESEPRSGSLLQGRPWRPLALSAICLLGVGISIYLLIVHYEPQALVCSNGVAIDCSAVLKSPSSVIFGIPVPYFGLVFFVGMGVACLPAAWRSEAAWLAQGRVAAAVAGVGMVVYFIYQEAIVLHKICLWCTGVHILTFIIFLIVVSGWEDTGYALISLRGPTGRARRAAAPSPAARPSSGGRARTSNIRLQRPTFCRLNYPGRKLMPAFLQQSRP